MANLEQRLQFASANFINIDDNRQLFTNHYNKVRDTLYSNLKEEQPLGKWLCGHKLGGSYGDNVKITKPDEFDLVMHLRFPENDRIIIKKDPKKPGNVFLDMTEVLYILQNQEHNKITFTSLKKIVTDKNLLLEDKLQNMIKGSVTRALNKMDNKVEVNGKITKLIYKNCGPAHTIFVNEGAIKYSVDFVPAVRLSEKQNVLGREELKYFKNIPFWDAIPKPMKPFEPNNVSFRASYYEAENIMLKDKNNCKNAIKFMKKFRDSKQNMMNLKSYYIKSLILWQIKARPLIYWRDKQLNEILIDMFDELSKCLTTTGKNGKLLFFWDPNLDLFASFNANQRKDMFNCVIAQKYTLSRAAGNLTDDIGENVISSFSVRQEREIEIKMQNLLLGNLKLASQPKKEQPSASSKQAGTAPKKEQPTKQAGTAPKKEPPSPAKKQAGTKPKEQSSSPMKQEEPLPKKEEPSSCNIA